MNAAAFLYLLALGEERTDVVYSYAVIPYRLVHLATSHPVELLTPLSAMFMHGGWLHLLGNMLYLYIFGDNVEDFLGPRRFLLFYLLCGVASFAAQIVLQSDSMVPNVGASGAIAGVLGAYFLLYPRARVVTIIPLLILFPVVEIPAYIFLGIWFLMQLLSSAASIGHTSALSGGVAWWAHVGGFVAGMVLLRFLRPRSRAGRPVGV